LSAQEAYLTDIAHNASTIVVSSQFGAKDCLRLYPTTRERLFIMPFRVTFAQDLLGEEGPDAIQAFNLPARYILVCNQFWQNKNHGIVFEAMSRLKAAGTRVNVVCTGHVYDPRLPNYSDRVHAMVHQLGIAQETFLLGAVPRSHQVDLMRKAVALLQPSLFEGWNTSIEEARAIGRPVIASDIPVHREQRWAGMQLFSPDDADGLATSMQEVWQRGEGGRIDLAREEQAQQDYSTEVMRFAQRFRALSEGAFSPAIL
jgi:glycosyltransferase involved in cell wall biosynthesis